MGESHGGSRVYSNLDMPACLDGMLKSSKIINVGVVDALSVRLARQFCSPKPSAADSDKL